MTGRRGGFTMVELMITMVIFVMAILAASNIFTGLLTQFKQQSSIAETNLQGVTGLEMLRFDVEQAGFGLPWDMNGLNYNEADTAASNVYDSSVLPTTTPSAYNDAGPPRALVAGDNVLMNNSDVLVIKGTNAATNKAAYRWTYMVNTAGTNSDPMVWGPASDNLADGDCVLVMTGASRKLGAGGSFYAAFKPLSGSWPTSLLPSVNTFNLIYGIKEDCTGGSAEPPRMPFNRADYYVRRPATGMPSRCAPGTGVLYKGTIVNTTGGAKSGRLNELPILDCVADMQVVLAADTNGDGTPDTDYTGQTLAPDVVRNNLKDVRVYLVVQEGQKDTAYTYNSPTISIADPTFGTLDTLDLQAKIGNTEYKYYRWKIYSMVIKPYNLR